MTGYSIERLLLERGIEPQYRRAGYGMYLSPLRNERTASFKVDYGLNLWYDFGTGEGGGPVDLCMRLDRLGFREAADRLSGGDFRPVQVSREPAVKIITEGVLSSEELAAYTGSRGISRSVARGYCRELLVSVRGKRHLVAGFRNDCGGWEMRNAYMKISSSPKTVTTFRGEGGICHVFEGFMDYLSFLTLGGGRLEGTAVVLNSVANLRHCMPTLQRSEAVFCWLDNDDAGKRTAERIREVCPKAAVVDCSARYGRYKDLNDFLTEKSTAAEDAPAAVKALKTTIRP